MKNKVCPIFDEFPEVFDEKIGSMKCLECRQRKYDSDEILSPMLESACREKIQKEKYLKYVKELYDKGYKFIIKVTDENNISYLLADNPIGLYETKKCIDWYDKYDGIKHFTKEEAKKEVDNFQQSHPNWIVQIKEISFDKK